MLKKWEKIFRVLGQPTRLKIALLLSRRELCVCELEAILGITQSAVSQHLRAFKDADLVEESRDRQWIFYSLKKEVLKDLLSAFLAAVEEQSPGSPELDWIGLKLEELKEHPEITCRVPTKGGKDRV